MRIGRFALNVQRRVSPKDAKGKPHLERCVCNEETKVENGKPFGPGPTQPWVYNICRPDEHDVFEGDHDESHLQSEESHCMSDDTTNAVFHTWLLYVINEDHSEPSNENELDGKEDVSHGQKSLEACISFAREAEMNVVENHVEEKGILE